MGPIARSLGFEPWSVHVTAAGLVCYGLALLALAVSRKPASGWAVASTTLDVGWVIASVTLVALRPVPIPLVLGIAGVVMALAITQAEGLRRSTFTNDLGRFATERRVDVGAPRAWVVLSDVEGYADLTDTLHRSSIVSGSGVGMVRKCEDTKGTCWLETCVRWEEGQAYAFDVDTSGTDYPLPLREMRGDFEVDALNASSCVIRIRFAFRARGGWFTRVLLATTRPVHRRDYPGSLGDSHAKRAILARRARGCSPASWGTAAVTDSIDPLQRPFKLGSLTLPNRIVSESACRRRHDRATPQSDGRGRVRRRCRWSRTPGVSHSHVVGAHSGKSFDASALPSARSRGRVVSL